MKSFEREQFEAYERTPDVHAYPSYPMGEIARELGTDIRLAYQHAIRSALRSENFDATFRQRVTAEEFDLPPIEVIDNVDEARKRLEEFGYDHASIAIQPDEALLILRLPNPMNIPYQWKAVPDPDQKKWKQLYKETLDSIYDAIEKSLQGKNAELSRINAKGMHDAEHYEGYYYLFLVSPHGREPIPTGYPNWYEEPDRRWFDHDSVDDEDKEEEQAA